jgi:hypothetical protein
MIPHGLLPLKRVLPSGFRDHRADVEPLAPEGPLPSG